MAYTSLMKYVYCHSLLLFMIRITSQSSLKCVVFTIFDGSFCFGNLGPSPGIVLIHLLL